MDGIEESPGFRPPGFVDLEPAIAAHYERVGPLLEAGFAGEPIVYANFLAGFGEKPHYAITGIPLAATKLVWLVYRKFAVEYHGWAPLPTDEDRLRFARLILSHSAFDRIRTGAMRIRRHLQDDRLDGAILLDGFNGIALWIPVADAPLAEVVRRWLHRLCKRAIAADPDLFSDAPNTVNDDRVHLHVLSNARHHFSVLPYSLRGASHLPVATPILWDELEDVNPDAFTIETFPARLAERGDIFAMEVKRIGDQHFPEVTRMFLSVPDMEAVSAPRGRVIVAAITILEDGRVRNADQILAEALARGLVPSRTTRKYIYTALIEYIARARGHGRKPQIVQDAERNFRINEPADDWPDFVDLPAPAPDADADAIIARLDDTSTGEDPTAFELACCDAFAHLGFLTRHLGARAEPDGVADAQLGPLGYRIVLECKTAKGVVGERNVAPEAAKFMAPYHAGFAVVIGPEFPEELELLNELKDHKVTAFTVAEIATLLHVRANPLEVRAIFVPGFATEEIGDLLWERRHGRLKRLATVAHLIRREGWDAQRTAAAQDVRGDAPRLNVEAAILLVDKSLRDAGSTQACTREEVETAFSHLTDPLVGAAVWFDEWRSSIVILSPASDD